MSKIYFGSEKKGFELIFDTGSAWVWVGDKNCQRCANPNKFNHTESTSYQCVNPDLQILMYGKGTILGYDSTDQVCLTPNSTIGNGCMENYKFRDVVYQEYLDGLAGSGLVGLAPTPQGSDA